MTCKKLKEHIKDRLKELRSIEPGDSEHANYLDGKIDTLLEILDLLR